MLCAACAYIIVVFSEQQWASIPRPHAPRSGR